MKKIIVFFIAILFASYSQSQIVEGTIITGDGLDFNNDGTVEFSISSGNGTNDYIIYYDINTDNNVWTIGNLETGSWDLPSNLALGTEIGSTANWEAQGDASMIDWQTSSSVIPTNTDCYIGLKFLLGANTHYGWAKVRTADGETFDWLQIAYESTPNTSINAGELAGETTTYTITATAGANGTITPSGAITANAGESMTFTIAANSGYQIATVLVDGTDMGAIASYEFTNISADHSISATFEEEPITTTYTITATAGANGTITPSGEVTVNEGEDQAFTITANTGYHIVSVLVDGFEDVTNSLVEGVYTFTNVVANHTINATFEITTNIAENISEVSIYPNPVSEILSIELTEQINSIEIVSMNGQIINKVNVNSNKYNYNVNNITAGNYFVNIYTDNGMITREIIVKK